MSYEEFHNLCPMWKSTLLNKVLNSFLLFLLTLLCFLYWKGWLAVVPCSPSPCDLSIILSPTLSSVSLTGRRVLSWFIINHIKALTQSFVSLVSLLSTFPYAVPSFTTKDMFLTKGKTCTGRGGCEFYTVLQVMVSSLFSQR